MSWNHTVKSKTDAVFERMSLVVGKFSLFLTVGFFGLHSFGSWNSFAEDFKVLKTHYTVVVEPLDATGMSFIEDQIGYVFSDKTHLTTALTAQSSHPSDEDYERYEFFGDKILDFYLAKILMQKYPEASPGELTSARNALVRQETLAALSLYLELYRYIKTKSLTTIKISHLGNAMEAVIAAIYYDGGPVPTEKFINDFFTPMLNEECPVQEIEILKKLARDQKINIQYSKNNQGEVQIVSGVFTNVPGILNRPIAPGKENPARLLTYLSERTFIQSISMPYSSWLVTLPLDEGYRRSSVTQNINSIAAEDPIKNFIWNSNLVSEPSAVLNEWLQKIAKNKKVTFNHKLENNRSFFTCWVAVDGHGVFEGNGFSKKHAERMASEKAYRSMQVSSLLGPSSSSDLTSLELEQLNDLNAISCINEFCQSYAFMKPAYESRITDRNGDPAYYTQVGAPWLLNDLEGDLCASNKDADQKAAIRAMSYIRHLITQTLQPKTLSLLLKFKNIQVGAEKRILKEVIDQLRLKFSVAFKVCDGSVRQGIYYRAKMLLSGENDYFIFDLEGACMPSKVAAENVVSRIVLQKLANYILAREIPGF